jgi:predicted DNA-binding protein
MLFETNGDTRMATKLEQVAVRLEPELRERLQRAADQDQRPLAGLIRKILNDATKQAPETGAHAA